MQTDMFLNKWMNMTKGTVINVEPNFKQHNTKKIMGNKVNIEVLFSYIKDSCQNVNKSTLHIVKTCHD